MKKIPLRTCVITKEKCEKKDLLRVVRTPEGNVIYDKTSRANGKGAYVKKDMKIEGTPKDIALYTKKEEN